MKVSLPLNALAPGPLCGSHSMTLSCFDCRCDHSPPFLMRSMQHFPLIGAAIGIWGAVFFNAAAVLVPPAVAAAASTLATVHITGCFHEDGLADVFDGFGA